MKRFLLTWKAVSSLFTFTFLFLPSLEIRAAWKLQVRKTYATHEHLVRTHGRGWRVAAAAGSGDQIVLVHAVAADPDRAHQYAVLIKRRATRKYLNAVRQTGHGSARDGEATQRSFQIRFDQINLEAHIEDAPLVELPAERT